MPSSAPAVPAQTPSIHDLKLAFFSNQSDAATKGRLLRNITDISEGSALTELLAILDQLDSRSSNHQHVWNGHEQLARCLDTLAVEAIDLSSLAEHKNPLIRLVFVKKAALKPEENRGILLTAISDSSKEIAETAVDSLANCEKPVFDQNLVEALLKNIYSSSCDLSTKLNKVFPALSSALAACPNMAESVCGQISHFVSTAAELDPSKHDSATSLIIANAALKVISLHSAGANRELLLKFMPEPFGTKVYGSSMDGRMADLLKLAANTLAELHEPEDESKWKTVLAQTGNNVHWTKEAAVNYLKNDPKNVDLLLQSSNLDAVQAGVEMCLGSEKPEDLEKLKAYSLSDKKNYPQITKIIEFLFKNLEQNWEYTKAILDANPQYQHSLIKHLDRIEKASDFEKGLLNTFLSPNCKDKDLISEAIVVLLKWSKANPEINLSNNEQTLANFVGSYKDGDYNAQTLAGQIYSEYPQAFKDQPQALARILGIRQRDIALKAEADLFSNPSKHVEVILYVARMGPPDMAQRAILAVKSDSQALDLALAKLSSEEDALLRLSLTSTEKLLIKDAGQAENLDTADLYVSREALNYTALLNSAFENRLLRSGAADSIIYLISSHLHLLPEQNQALEAIHRKDSFLCFNYSTELYQESLSELLRNSEFRAAISKRISLSQIAVGPAEIQGPGLQRSEIPASVQTRLEPSTTDSEKNIQFLVLSKGQSALEVTVDNTSRGVRGKSGSVAREIVILGSKDDVPSVLYSWSTGMTLYN
jgi:hypothetical protein